ncbi:hypothetical protein QE152_g31450 [Popillia japonica]|uniref:Uncharacterized protein n=1 Tax=Popillia japonica TaxID=7064 RepID=A0AAW1J189_POPJA
MSSAMRSTLQTVPESHEVTRGADSSGSAKTPVKLTSDSSKPRSTFSYHTTSATNGSAKTPVKLTSDSSKPRSTFSYHTTSATNKAEAVYSDKLHKGMGPTVCIQRK